MFIKPRFFSNLGWQNFFNEKEFGNMKLINRKQGNSQAILLQCFIVENVVTKLIVLLDTCYITNLVKWVCFHCTIIMLIWLFLLVITIVNDFGRVLVVYKFNRVILVYENFFLNSFEILGLRSRFSFDKKYNEIFKWFYWFYTSYIGRGGGFIRLI